LNKQITCFFLILPVAFCGQAQDASKNQVQDIVRHKEVTLGIKLHTQGYGVVANFGKILNIRKKNLWEIELQEIKHPKEQKVQSLLNSDGGTNRYTFGKINNFYNLNVLIGRERVLSEKLRQKGVSFSFLYKLGASLGITKPYYLQFYKEGKNEQLIIEKYSEENKDSFLEPGWIVGRGGFGYGLDEIRPVPGGVIKTAIEADWASNNRLIKSLEAGMMVNAYYKKIPLMALSENPFIFVNLYLSLKLGNRS